MTNTLFPEQKMLDDVLVALRRIVRSIDLHSKKLIQSHRLTIPQVVLLREIQRRGRVSLGDLARSASLSNATVTGIVDRLEARGLVRRERGDADRRQVFVEVAPAGAEAVKALPPLLQEDFVRKLEGLQKWEQAQILSSLERVAGFMDEGRTAAEPILVPHALTDTADDLGGGEGARSGAVKGKGPGAERGAGRPEEAVSGLRLHVARSLAEFPPGVDLEGLTRFLHESLKPYEDAPEDIERGILDALQAEGRPGGFLVIAEIEGALAGALVMQGTGMKGYVPENLLLFVAVAPERRGRSLGRLLIERAVRETEGNIKLHVEYDNPARRLYERIGFTSKYAEMRYVK